jgi:acetyl-CoA/propionyl-CoA carboxylase biotin carboxyl carrier protein
VVEVNGKRIEVVLQGDFTVSGKKAKKKSTRTSANKTSVASGDAITAPMQGTVVKVNVSNGDVVAIGDLVVVLEAMKMEQPLTAHKAGKISGLIAQVGTTVQSGTVLCEIKE